jgi:hypothetical protein
MTYPFLLSLELSKVKKNKASILPNTEREEILREREGM